jgi:hypothetical protein
MILASGARGPKFNPTAAFLQLLQTLFSIELLRERHRSNVY